MRDLEIVSSKINIHVSYILCQCRNTDHSGMMPTFNVH